MAEIPRHNENTFADSTISSSVARVGRRSFDLLVAIICLILLLPILLYIVLRLKKEKGDILFRQQRIGKGGKPFQIYKFRTMVPEAESLKGDLENQVECSRLFRVENDPRVTRFGKSLRKYDLDEIPQLINVLRGEMSIVGPRPSLAAEVAHYEDHHMARLAVKPGITGLWQVDKRRRWVFEEMVELDVHYIRNRSMLLDLSILARTLKILVWDKQFHV